MATNIQVNVESNPSKPPIFKDLDQICEISRGPEDFNRIRKPPIDPSLVSSSSGLTNVSQFFPPINLNYDSGFDLSPYISTPNHDQYFAAKIGYRPRILRHSQTYEEAGDSTRKYFFVFRTEETLYIMRKYTGETYYSTIKEISKASFPQGIVPYILFFELVAGGGGGGGGAVLGAAGGGAGGGSIAYGWMPLRTASTFSREPLSNDFIFSIFRGGTGGSWQGPDNGTNGSPSTIVQSNGSRIITCNGGEKGTRGLAFDHGEAGKGGTVIIHNSFYYLTHINGGNGGKWSNGQSLNFSRTIELEPISWSAQGGVALQVQLTPPGGGGASRGDGGNGGNTSKEGYKGGGGGGGPSGIGKAGRGGHGGNGNIAFFY